MATRYAYQSMPSIIFRKHRPHLLMCKMMTRRLLLQMMMTIQCKTTFPTKYVLKLIQEPSLHVQIRSTCSIPTKNFQVNTRATEGSDAVPEGYGYLHVPCPNAAGYLAVRTFYHPMLRTTVIDERDFCPCRWSQANGFHVRNNSQEQRRWHIHLPLLSSSPQFARHPSSRYTSSRQVLHFPSHTAYVAIGPPTSKSKQLH